MKLHIAFTVSLLLSMVPLKAAVATTPPEILSGIDAMAVTCSVQAGNPQEDNRHADRLLDLFKRSAAYWTEATKLRDRVFSTKTSAEIDELRRVSKRPLSVYCQLIVTNEKFIEEIRPKRVAVIRFSFRKSSTGWADEPTPPPDFVFPIVLSNWPDEIYTEAFRTQFHEMVSRSGFSVLPYMYPLR